ncbi:MAG: hypothetical protein CMJ42_17080 [Phyllobacteriaceae bacterium]|nr:hypothetical protein [Phyllobacteriaceae bacterium]MBA92317.1 hypothetical protein [Phyllobacteriaceae bacterium]
MKKVSSTICAALFAACFALVAPVDAQDSAQTTEPEGFWLTTSYPEFTIEPGEKETVNLTLRNANLPPQRASLEVIGVPEGWDWALKGGGNAVTAAIVAPDSTERLTLELTPPDDAAIGGEHNIEIQARTAVQTLTLPLTIRLAASDEVTTAGLTLEPELPALSGTARSTFSFKIKVTNEGEEDGLFNLAADVPRGFRTRFKKGFGSEEITGVPIAAGATETVTMEVVPSPATQAGRYPIGFEVAGNGESGTTELSLNVTGEPEVRIVGPQERLSGNAVTGKTEEFVFTLVNTGSAPAADVELAATPPSGWSVEFEPENVTELAPNSTEEVSVRITPSENAIAGDYMVAIRVTGEPVSENVQFRVTVSTSTWWGVIGLGVIAVAAIILVLAVMRYGRR